MRPAGYSTAVASHVTGPSPRMVGHWVRTGLIKPSIDDGAGKGRSRRFSFEDLIAIKTVHDLRMEDCPLQKIRAVVKHLSSLGPEVSGSGALTR